MSSGSKLDEEVWQEYHLDRTRLTETATAILRNYRYLIRPQSLDEESELVNEDEEFPEGRILSRLHVLRERNSSVVRKKKAKVLHDAGKLACEACGFDFGESYGQIGLGFAECHHNIPLSEISERKIVKMSDLVIVCANCHRMLHRIRPWLQVKQLKWLVDGQK